MSLTVIGNMAIDADRIRLISMGTKYHGAGMGTSEYHYLLFDDGKEIELSREAALALIDHFKTERICVA